MQRSLRAARLATFVFFALDGFLIGTWVVHIPAVEHRVGIGHPTLGWLLLLLGAGAFVGMRLVGPLADRFGAHIVVPVSAALCASAVVLPGLSANVWTLGMSLLALGFGNGCLDVAMNAHAVRVEHRYQRSVMSAFHATYSLGGVLAALVGARTLSWGWSSATALGMAALLGLVGAALAAPALLRPESPRPAGVFAVGERRVTPRRIWLLAGLALLLMLCEGVANDWSALHLRDVLAAPPATAALAYGAFATAMTVGRLLADRVATRFGSMAVLRYGTAIGAVGMLTAALSPWIPLALVGWTVFGAGLSGCVPQLFSAAGHADRNAAGANVARVAGLGYLGVLAGPAIIGPLTHLAPLNIVLLLPVAFCVVAAVAANVLRPQPSSAAHSADLIPDDALERAAPRRVGE
ncbi:MFS transporter [Nocardia sp. NBC_01499]|uniref:MFS transporter n=1 Tax=Nocardia sp. NBC_01499 TaxID=2903597 RepID=UPI00386AA1EC